METDIPFIHMYEGDITFYNKLNDLCKKFPSRLRLENINLLNISKLMHPYHICFNKQNIFESFGTIKEKQWQDESYAQIIGVTNKPRFIDHLIISTIFQTCFMLYGRPTFYLAVLPSVWKRFTQPRHQSSSSIMFQLLFNYKLLGSVDRKAFIPWPKYNKSTHEDYFQFYIVKFEPKPELLETFKGKNNLIYFWHFVRYNLYKKSSRVIPALEKLVPGCGTRLIKINYNIFTQFNDLNVGEIFDLFMEFQSWPEFSESIFVTGASEVKDTFDTYLRSD